MEKDPHGRIVVRHINVRQSISILVFKILTLDVIAATLIVLFFVSLVEINPNASLANKVNLITISVFTLLGIAKIALTVYVVLEWLNEYYEITPKEIIHKSGLIIRNEKIFQFDNVKMIKIYQTLLGKMLNYGTIGLYDIRRNKRVEMYLIHNPQRYLHILENLINNPHEEKRIIREHIFEKDLDDEDDDEESL